jgi:hypothetical protein
MNSLPCFLRFTLAALCCLVVTDLLGDAAVAAALQVGGDVTTVPVTPHVDHASAQEHAMMLDNAAHMASTCSPKTAAADTCKVTAEEEAKQGQLSATAIAAPAPALQRQLQATAAAPAAAAAAAAGLILRTQRDPEQQDNCTLVAMCLALQHATDALHPGTVAAMLCSSRRLQRKVHEQLHGQLDVRLTDTAALASFTLWVRKHGCLLRQLHLQLDGLELLRAVAAAAAVAAHPGCKVESDLQSLADAMRNAAATTAAWQGPGRLQLQAVSCSVPSTALLTAVAQTCSSSSLTSLRFSLAREADSSHMQEAAALSGLTALRSLSIEAADCYLPLGNAAMQQQLQRLQKQQQLALQPLSGLAQLTSLSITNALSVDALALLPAQLQQLKVQFAGSAVRQSFSLCNLTALTELATNLHPDEFRYLQPSSSSSSSDSSNIEQVSVLLPQTLQRLTLFDRHTGQDQLPVVLLQQQAALQLPRLQVCVGHSCMTARELNSLKKLTGLTELQLGYSSMSAAVASAATWGDLPVKQLSIMNSNTRRQLQLPASAVRQLTGVTCLALKDCTLSDGLLGAVGSCSKLQHLSLQQCRGCTSTALVVAVQHLQQLRQLEISGSGAMHAAALVLKRIKTELHVLPVSHQA